MQLGSSFFGSVAVLASLTFCPTAEAQASKPITSLLLKYWGGGASGQAARKVAPKLKKQPETAAGVIGSTHKELRNNSLAERGKCYLTDRKVKKLGPYAVCPNEEGNQGATLRQ